MALRILIVKTSSLGDVIHTYPAVVDIKKQYPDAIIDWVVEEGFEDLVGMHPMVNQAIPVATRRWRKNYIKHVPEIFRFIKKLRENRYDYVIDAQGLFKSALITLLSRGLRCGYDKHSSRGRGISWAYQRCFSIEKDQHAISCTRKVFARALDYSFSDSLPVYGLENTAVNAVSEPTLVCLHATVWDSKTWPESYWKNLVAQAIENDIRVVLPSGNNEEFARANRIANNNPRVEVWHRRSFKELAELFGQASAIVSVDTGLGHFSTALGRPGLFLYGATDPKRLRPLGQHVSYLFADFPCAPCGKRTCQHVDFDTLNYQPCFETVPPQAVWNKLLEIGLMGK